jgi:excisionase family DNA binding protein
VTRAGSSLDEIFGPSLRELLDRRIRELAEQAIDARGDARVDVRDRSKRWLSVTETAEYLGISAKAVRCRIDRGTLPYTRQGRQLLIDRKELDQQLEKRKR